MKRIVTIIMLAALFIGGVAADAKTIQKLKGAKAAHKTQTKRDSSGSSWNGDIPSAELLYNYAMCHDREKSISEFKKHGYVPEDSSWDSVWVVVKPGVARFYPLDVMQTGVYIEVEDAVKRKWLYNDFKKFISTHKIEEPYELEIDGKAVMLIFPN